MTLLDLKPSTVEIDFTIPSSDIMEFEQALKSNSTGYKVDPVDRWLRFLSDVAQGLLGEKHQNQRVELHFAEGSSAS